MAEYIEREAALDALCKVSVPTFNLAGKPILDVDYVSAINSIPAADVRPVVTCGECKWWTKQEASLQGRCELMRIYQTGAWFCANGRRDDEKGL